MAHGLGVSMFGRSLEVLLTVCLVTGVACAAENPFVGEWKLDPSQSRLPDEMNILGKGGNTYVFDFGAGAETIVVDGTGQSGVGGTVLSVKPDGPDSWVVERRKDGRLLVRGTWKLSADGRTLTDAFRQFDADGTTRGTDYVYARKGGGSGFAADWKSIRETITTPYLLSVTAFDGDGLAFDNRTTHITKSVTFDGKEHAIEGANAPQGATSSARALDARNLLITDTIKGQVIDTANVGLSRDLKTLTMTQQIPGRERPNVFVFRRS